MTVGLGYSGIFASNLPQRLGPGTGVIWTPATIGNRNSWSCIDYGDGYFVALNQAISLQNVGRTRDGYNWTEVNSPNILQYTAIAFGDGVFIGLAQNGGGNQIIRSTDWGLTWVAIAEPSTRQWTDVCYCGNGIFFAVAQDGVGVQFMRSTDYGQTWVSIAEPSTRQWMSCFCNRNTGVVIAVAQDGAAGVQIARSTDSGATWASIAAPAARPWQSVTWGNNIWAAVGNDTGATGNAAMYSNDDGATWIQVASYLNQNWTHICWGYEKFVVTTDAGGVGTFRQYTSYDATAYLAHYGNSWTGCRNQATVFGYDRFVSISTTGSLNALVS